MLLMGTYFRGKSYLCMFVVAKNWLMKRFTMVALILLLFLQGLYAQLTRPNCDSLSDLLSASRTEDTNKVRILIEYFRCFYPADKDSAILVSEQIISLSKRLHYTVGIIRGMNAKALCEWYGKDPQQAVPTFREVYEIAMKQKNADLQALVTNNMGVYYMQFGQSDTAEKYLQLSLKISKPLPDQSRYAKTAGDLSMIYLNKGDYIESISLLLESLQYYERIEKKYDIIINRLRLGLIYHDIGDFDNAAKALKGAREVNQSFGDKNLENTLNLNTGVLYYQVKKDPDSAAIFLNKAKEMAAHLPGQELMLLMATVNLGNVAIMKKDYHKALDYYTGVIESPLLQSRNHERSAVLVNLGEIYQHLGQYDKAEKYAREGVALAHANSFLKYEKTGYDVLAAIAVRKKNFQEAYRYKITSDSLQECIWNEDIKKKVTEATFSLALKQKDNKNSLLQKENEIKAKTIFHQRFLIGGTVMILLLVIILTMVISRNHRRQQQLNQELDLKNKQLAESNQTKDKFLSIIAHDLKSPFNALLGLLSELDEHYTDFDEATRREIIHKLRISSRNTFNLLENLLDWTQSQRGKIECVPLEFRVAEVITEVLAVLGSRAEAKKQRFAMTADAELSIHSDPRLLKAILINLVNNSIKFSPENKEIRVIATRDTDTVKITVSDQGIGIPADQLTRLFGIDSPFKRKGTNNEPGTGLGLIMCQEYVTLLGGSIRAESTEGTGSSFVINLPLQYRQNSPV